MKQIRLFALVIIMLLPLALQAKRSTEVFMLKAEYKHSQQGMDVWNNQAFCLEDGGWCRVFDLKTKSSEPLAAFPLASKAKNNHANCCNFGVETKPGASFPLLYVSVGKAGVKMEWDCHVESITKDAQTWRSELAQTLRLDASGFSAKGLQSIFGCPAWLVDRKTKTLWVFSAKKRTTAAATGAFSTNNYVATRFRLPKLAEGALVTLTAADVENQVVLPFDTYFTQGGTVWNGKIYYCFGLGEKKGGVLPSRIRVYDTKRKTISERIELRGIIDEEMEDLSIWNGHILANTNSRKIYIIK